MESVARLSMNGQAPRKAEKQKASRKEEAGRKVGRLARRVSVAVGSVGIVVLGLSVHHCTEAISLLTGSHWGLGALLAIGIDAGMVASELAELVAFGTKAQRTAGKWARGYILTSVLLSVLLNAYAFGLHASEGMVWAAWILGAVIPGLVYALGRVAGHLWIGE